MDTQKSNEKSAPSSPPALTSEELRYKRKYKELKKKIKDISNDNDELLLRVARSRKAVKRLQLERKILFEKLEKTHLEDGSLNLGAEESDNGADDTDASEMSEGSATVGNKRRARASRDPNAPKRPANAFFLFCQLERSKIKDDIASDATVGDITKALGVRWKTMPDEEKKKYYELYEKDKKRYASEMDEYTGKEKSLPSAKDNSTAKQEQEDEAEPEIDDQASTQEETELAEEDDADMVDPL